MTDEEALESLLESQAQRARMFAIINAGEAVLREVEEDDEVSSVLSEALVDAAELEIEREALQNLADFLEEQKSQIEAAKKLARAQNGEPDPLDSPEVQFALRHTRAPKGGEPIQLMRQRSAIRLHGKPMIAQQRVQVHSVKPHHHRKDGLQYRSQVERTKALRAIKDSYQGENEMEELQLSPIQENILMRKIHRDLAEAVANRPPRLTLAQKSIQAHQSRAIGDPSRAVSNYAPDDHEMPAIRIPDYDTRSMLPKDEFQPKPNETTRAAFPKEFITPTQDNSFVAQMKRTKAQQTIQRPTGSHFPNPVTDDDSDAPAGFVNNWQLSKNGYNPNSEENSGANSYKDSEQKKTRQTGFEKAVKGLRGKKI